MQVKRAPQGPGAYPRWAVFFFLAASLACYLPALGGGIIWDDQAHITAASLQSMGGLFRIWFHLGATQQYYPVLHSAFWIEHRLWGDATLGYHLLNALLHGLSAWLVVVLLQRLAVPGALLSGIFFLVHPVCVESVAWISEQKNTLSLVFYLLAALAYVRFDESEESRPSRLWWVATGWFALAILSKSVTATLPAALLVLFWWKRGRLSWRRDVAFLAPWFALALGGGLTTAWVERTYIGAEGAEFTLSLSQRCLLASRIIWFYFEKLVWPNPLVFVYPHWDVAKDAAGWWGYAAAAIALTAVLWLLRNRWRGPMAGWLFFVGSLAPALGFFNVYPFRFSYVADHFQYLASLGIITVGAGSLWHGLSHATGAVKSAGWAVCIAVTACLAVLTCRQSRVYRDVETLYKSTLEQNPDAWMAHYNLGIILAQEGRPAEAISHFQTAVRLKPDYAEAMANWGSALYQMGDVQGAIQEFEASLRINPSSVEAHTNLGDLLPKVGRLDEAILQCREALRLDPAYSTAHFNLANCLRRSGHIPEAIQEYQLAIKERPGYVEALLNLGGACYESGRLDEAAVHYEAVLSLNPNFAAAHANLGYVLRKLGRQSEARAQFEQAAALGAHP